MFKKIVKNSDENRPDYDTFRPATACNKGIIPTVNILVTEYSCKQITLYWVIVRLGRTLIL